MKEEKTDRILDYIEVFALIIYLICATGVAVIGNFPACLAWIACSVVQLTLILVRRDLYNDIDVLREDVEFYREERDNILKVNKEFERINSEVFKQADDLCILNKSILGTNGDLNFAVDTLIKYIPEEKWEEINEEVREKDMLFSNTNVPGGEYKLFVKER